MTTDVKDIGDGIFATCRAFLDSHGQEIDKRVSVWIDARDFSGFSMILVKSDANNCLVAGAIALRKYSEFQQALSLWRTARRALDALAAGIAARNALGAGEFPEPDKANFRAGDLLYLQYCLLFAGARGNLSTIRGYYDLPIVQLNDVGERVPNIMSAEARLQFAAWEGELALVEELLGPMEVHYKRFKLPLVYTQLWRAVAMRDGAMLERLLPVAEAAYKKSAKRRNNDIWGGGMPYNDVMFDIYTTSVLKIARDVGMSWTYVSEFAKSIWPVCVLKQWESA